MISGKISSYYIWHLAKWYCHLWAKNCQPGPIFGEKLADTLYWSDWNAERNLNLVTYWPERSQSLNHVMVC